MEIVLAFAIVAGLAFWSGRVSGETAEHRRETLRQRRAFEESKGIAYPFRGLVRSLKAKDANLYASLCHLPPGEFVREWQKNHPEDFAQ